MATITKNHTVSINIAIPYQTLQDLFCTAVEGGSNYWARVLDTKRDAAGDYASANICEHLASQINQAYVVVTPEDLAKGLSRLAAEAAKPDGMPTAGKHFADALGDHDAGTADVVLQMTIFGEVVYG